MSWEVWDFLECKNIFYITLIFEINLSFFHKRFLDFDEIYMKKIILVILILILAGTGYWFYKEQQYESLLKLSVNPSSKKRVSFVIEKNESLQNITKNLFESDLIRDQKVFLRYTKEQGADRSILPGKYLLRSSFTIPEITDILSGKKRSELSITIPEGFTIKKIDQLLVEKELIQAGEFLNCAKTCRFPYDFIPENKNLEGYLFPSTYYVHPETFDVLEFMNQLLGTFDQQIAPLQKNAIKRSLQDIIIMASLIEREAISNEERPVIAGILWKRLDNNWYLGVDATTRYYKDDWVGDLTSKDFEEDNAYNTRKNLGLPPTPIANPGLASLKAAFMPEESEYWYYLHDSESKIHYGKTLEEHNLNRAKYIF